MWYGFKKQLTVTTQTLQPGEAPTTPIKVTRKQSKPSLIAPPAGMAAGADSANADEKFIARSPQLNTSDKFDARLADEPDEGSDTIAWWPLGGGYGEAGGEDGDLEPNNE